MERWIPIEWDLASSDDRDRIFAWCWTWTRLHEGKPVTRREVQEKTGWGWRKAQKLINRCTEAQSDWAGRKRAGSGPEPGQGLRVISDTCEDNRAKTGPATGQDRAGPESSPRPIQVQDTITKTLKEIWDELMSVSAEGSATSSKLKMTAWRKSMLGERLGDYSREEIVRAWRWWNVSVDEHAEFLRRNRGRAGIDTFLRRSNHDKYQAFAEGWKSVREEPGPDASIEEMRDWLDYKNRLMIQNK
jgi:hypothetical protein